MSGLCHKTRAGRAPQPSQGRRPPPARLRRRDQRAGRLWRSPPHLGAPRGYLAQRAPTGQGARPRDAASCRACSATPGRSSHSRRRRNMAAGAERRGEERREAPPQSPAAGRRHRAGARRGERVVARRSHSGGCTASPLFSLLAHPRPCEGNGTGRCGREEREVGVWEGSGSAVPLTAIPGVGRWPPS